MAGTPRRVGRLASGAALVVATLFALAVLAPALIGWERYAIVSGSMTGTYDRGSLVLAEVVPAAELKVGDVITYTPPPGSGPTGLVTHRIAWIGSDQFGRRVLRTKGDANQAVDPWTFTLDGETQARVSFHVPYVGYALAALSIRKVRMLVVGLPALLIAVAILAGLRRDARRERIALAHEERIAPEARS
jgi:signal peptidase